MCADRREEGLCGRVKKGRELIWQEEEGVAELVADGEGRGAGHFQPAGIPDSSTSGDQQLQ